MFFSTILLVGFFIVAFFLQKRLNSTSKKALLGLILGLILGFILKVLLSDLQVESALKMTNTLSSFYLRLLQMTVIPLIFVSIITGLIKISNKSEAVKFLIGIVGTLMLTASLVALIGIFISEIMGLHKNFTYPIEQTTLANLPKVPQDLGTLLMRIVPTNPFAALAGVGENTVLSVVFLSFVIGFASLSLKGNSKFYEVIYNNMMSMEKIVFVIIKTVVRMTPYFLIPIMAKTILMDYSGVFGQFFSIFATVYISVLLGLFLHLILITLLGYNPIIYLKKTFGILSIAFSTASSSVTLPLSKEMLEKRMGVRTDLSNLGPSLALTIGQNGCAGIYPAVIAFITAPLVGIDPTSLDFILKLVFVIMISSLGVGGVGGGGTLSSLIVLPIMGLPIDLVIVFLAIEPIIDMARTALNVSGGWVATLVTAKLTGNINKDDYNNLEL